MMDSSAEVFPDWGLDQNLSIPFNKTAANASAPYGVLSPGVSKAISALMITFLFTTMVAMGCTMEISKIKQNMLNPKGVSIAALAQYGIMPLTAFTLTKAFRLEGIMAVTVLLCGCGPGGTLSNIMALAAKGDMNLSIVMTSCSTVLALGMMPLLLLIYCQGVPNLHRLVPYTQIIMSLFMILVPCGVGIGINRYRPQYSNIILKLGIFFLMTSIVVIGIMLTIDIGDNILSVLSPPLMATCWLMPLVGYIFGYVLASLFKLNHAQRRTIAMETGCQNTQLCATILKVAFPPELMGSLFLFPMVYAAIQMIEAAILILLFRFYERIRTKKKGTDLPAATDENAIEPLKGGRSA